MAAISEILARELGCAQAYVENIITLLDEGNTIPFIARYRKEQHGSMDDTTLRKLEDRLTYLRSLDQRRQEVKKPSTDRASSRRSSPPPSTRPRRSRRWRISTAPISRSAAPARPPPARRGLSRWRSCSMRRSAPARARRTPPRTSSSPKTAWKRSSMPCRAQTTSSPSFSRTTRPSARRCAGFSCGRGTCAVSRRRKRTPSTACTTTLTSPSRSSPTIRFSPSTAARRRASCPSRCYSTATRRSRCCAAPP